MKPLDWREYADGELALAAILGEFAAFDELVRRFRPAVLLVARQIVGAEAAEDVAQDAWLLAFKALPQLEDPERFGAWLHAVTRHRAYRFARGSVHREQTGHSDIDTLIIQQTPELSRHPAEELERDEVRREVREALARLPEELQTVLLLHYFQSMPVSRIAQFLQLPVTTVKWRLHRGRQLLKGRLDPSGGALAPARRGDEHER